MQAAADDDTLRLTSPHPWPTWSADPEPGAPRDADPDASDHRCQGPAWRVAAGARPDAQPDGALCPRARPRRHARRCGAVRARGAALEAPPAPLHTASGPQCGTAAEA